MQKRKGISLIVLVITIIVMIVLAGAIILSLNNAGVIEKANEAVKTTDEATVKELAQMAWAEAYAEGIRNVEDTEINGKKIAGLKTRIKETLIKNNLNVEEYGMLVTTKGVEITKGWLQDGKRLIKGEGILNIGQIVNYMATGTTYKGGWQVLGVDDEGNLLIISATNVNTSYRLGYESTDTTLKDRVEECQKDWLYGSSQLDSICSVYGKGEGAISARSIRIEDIDKITGYEKTTYGKGYIWQYNNTVTYFNNNSINPAYESSVKSGQLAYQHGNGFYYYDGKNFQHISAENLTNSTNNGKELFKLTSNYYGYVGSKYLDVSSEEYKMIFGEEGNYNYYWLASAYTILSGDRASFGVSYVYGGQMYNYALLHSTGDTNTFVRGVRAVVTISLKTPHSDLL